MQRLFQITLVLLLAVVSIVVLGLAISIVISVFSGNMMAESGGISFAVGGLTNRQLGAIVIAASLIVAGCFLFFRRRRFRG
ncbi:MAG TPA: hypothetical protein VHQ94_04535 [Pyrinomonadaceae bacterium]|jgi:TRAP-type C4-dicarboxylate transport system permease small subunit|nr:hypothetical protein [Pyrinomonadaceae bacterium]